MGVIIQKTFVGMGHLLASDKLPTHRNLYFIQTFGEKWVLHITTLTSKRIIWFQFGLIDGNDNPLFDADGNHMRLPSDTS